jgi:hypothetical protein
MATRVHFRFNKHTGEVEEFLVDDQNRQLAETDHERIALEVGRYIAAYPRLREVQEGRPVGVAAAAETADSPERRPTPSTERA